ncbi:alpha-amylase MalA [Halococcoides cellulosivorans]|uniref:Alpha-amylase n=1 Tax=Halococcoides cellulosivorans TaxID=1679096 RepID=A0A2R4X015_9EURY|nr:alpha-amylase MalA [Halococcoides cellulosivorans]AWB27109.1 alpha-amylase [Halococcoides cellulosivorans]
MHHPGPPRFIAAGETIDLAPRDPDPDATYRWSLTTPDDSAVSVGTDPVEQFTPDVSGTYVAHLDAPDGTHDQTIHVFGPEASTGLVEGERSGESGSPAYSAPEAADRDPGGRPRVHLDGHVEDDRVVVHAAALPNPAGEESPADLDVAFLVDDRDSIDRRLLDVDGREIAIPIAAIDDRVRISASAVGGAGYSVPDAIEIEVSDEAVTIDRPYDPPEWAVDAQIYEIYVRTFPGQDAAADGEGHAAGERSVFDAIVDRLDYIQSLGVDTLWLTPVLENDHAPHGYNITDFFAIAEDLGTREDYERLIEAAHERDLRVLFDLVCNHTARDHPYYQAAVGDPDSAHHEFYEWRGPGEPETYFDWEYIANVDFSKLRVRRHMLDAVDEWAPLVDGFRIDMAWAVPDSFWKEVHDRVKALDAEFLLLDETIPYIPDFQDGCFDMHFDSTTYAALRRVGNGEDADALLGAIDERAEIGFPPHAGFMLYAENHDESRYIVDCGRESAMAAAGALFTLPGSPLLYAGQEFGQRGKRDDLAWAHADEPLREFVRSLADVRSTDPALSARADCRRVAYTVADGWPDRVTAFARVTDDAASVVVLNFGEDAATVTVPAAASDHDAVTDERIGTPDGLVVERVAVLPADRSRLD